MWASRAASERANRSLASLHRSRDTHLPGFLVPWRLAAPAEIPYAAATFLEDAAWRTLAIAATLASLALTVLGWPQSRIGLALNLLPLLILVDGTIVSQTFSIHQTGHSTDSPWRRL